MLLTLPNVKYSQDEIKELDLKTSSQKVNHNKITAFDWPGGGRGGGGKEGITWFSWGREKRGGDLRKLIANERGENRISET